jgi:ubiquinone/menaquinone biosynthesis C-methylase UbiE
MNYKQLMWEQHHYRFGLAGERQADLIQSYLERERGRVLNIGCGPWGDKLEALGSYCGLLVGVDISIEGTKMAKATLRASNIALLVGEARMLPLENASIDYIVALGLFAAIPEANILHVFLEFWRVCRPRGYVMVTNSVSRPKEHYRQCGTEAGFHVLEDAEGYCPAASGEAKRRYLLVFHKADD